MNKIIKKIKTMKIFKNKNNSYKNDIQEDIVTTEFDMKERIESMNSGVYGLKEKASFGRRRDLDVDVKNIKSNTIVVNKDKYLSMDYYINEIDSDDDYGLKEMKRYLWHKREQRRMVLINT